MYLLLFIFHYFICHYANGCRTATFSNTFERSRVLCFCRRYYVFRTKNIFSSIPSEFSVDTRRYLICFSNFSLLSLPLTIHYISMLHVHLGTPSQEILDKLCSLLVAFVYLFHRFMHIYLRQVHLFHFIFSDHILEHNHISKHDISQIHQSLISPTELQLKQTKRLFF